MEVRTRADMSLNYKVAMTAELDKTLKAIEVDRLVEILSRPMKRHEIRSELETLRSKMVTWERVVGNEE